MRKEIFAQVFIRPPYIIRSEFHFFIHLLSYFYGHGKNFRAIVAHILSVGVLNPKVRPINNAFFLLKELTNMLFQNDLIYKLAYNN